MSLLKLIVLVISNLFGTLLGFYQLKVPIKELYPVRRKTSAFRGCRKSSCYPLKSVLFL
ncbi:hypothetical protein XBKQ1_1270001 [Xenorhabdus bovienii str. kraussei Quebec]|uniref:Uncharacterized protein n=1 Tax=Xenorhabdus bovienii str. kraussei Quebec TaxID=1398203 RepID=A0A077PCM1_XENBV|nr:hypothetical protein XBKQ1_1270001 [Xenorhabdus bovienii str. kraussei Quebec]